MRVRLQAWEAPCTRLFSLRLEDSRLVVEGGWVMGMWVAREVDPAVEKVEPEAEEVAEEAMEDMMEIGVLVLAVAAGEVEGRVAGRRRGIMISLIFGNRISAS